VQVLNGDCKDTLKKGELYCLKKGMNEARYRGKKETVRKTTVQWSPWTCRNCLANYPRKPKRRMGRTDEPSQGIAPKNGSPGGKEEIDRQIVIAIDSLFRETGESVERKASRRGPAEKRAGGPRPQENTPISTKRKHCSWEGA